MNAGDELRWSIAPSPLGELLLIDGDDGLIAVEYLDGRGAAEAAAARACAYGCTAVPDNGQLDGLRRELELFFAGSLTKFKTPVDWSCLEPFQRRVLQRCASVAYGKRITYGALAEEIGAPRAARAVGNSLRSNPVALVIPCHRVIRADGSLGGYGGEDQWQRKRRLLELERAAPLAA